MAETFHCVLAIRTRELFNDDIYYANVAGMDGMYGVLPNHELLVSLNKRGGLITLNLDEAGTKQEKFLVYDGATQMFNGMLTILGEFAVNVDAIDREAAQSDAEEAKKRIAKLEEKEADLTPQDKARLRVYRHRLRWDTFQLDYLDTGAHA